MFNIFHLYYVNDIVRQNKLTNQRMSVPSWQNGDVVMYSQTVCRKDANMHVVCIMHVY